MCIALVAGAVLRRPESMARDQCHVGLEEADYPRVGACNGLVAASRAGNAANWTIMSHAQVSRHPLHTFLTTKRGQNESASGA